MCELCDESLHDGIAYCPECGRMICYDFTGVDDISAPASASDAGDLMCLPCARWTHRKQQEMEDEELAWLACWEDYPGELLADNVNFVSE